MEPPSTLLYSCRCRRHRDLPDPVFPRGAADTSDGIRKAMSVHYRIRPADTLASIADSVFAGLPSADQICEANGIQDPAALDVGASLLAPLPCTCFNNSDILLPAISISYVVLDGDTVPAIAARYATTVTDIMNVNAMGSPVVKDGDILAVPLPGDLSSGAASLVALSLLLWSKNLRRSKRWRITLASIAPTSASVTPCPLIRTS